MLLLLSFCLIFADEAIRFTRIFLELLIEFILVVVCSLYYYMYSY